MNVHSVIVCFNPDVKRVATFRDLLLECGSKVVLVDNTEGDGSLDPLAGPRCEVLTLGRNTGIAHAQNLGIRRATASGADAIVIFDQDSKIDHDFLPTLTSRLRVGEPRVVAPVVVDDVTGREMPSTRLTRVGLPADVYATGQSTPSRVDVVIASGTAATKEVFDLAGLMDEPLFIDYVDTEWCLRCREKGVPIEVHPGSTMRHSIGSGALTFRTTTVLLHDPTRCYYQIRNCLLLFRKAHVPRVFALRETAALFWSRFLLLLHVPDRSAYMRAFVAGVIDGLRGVGGKRPHS